MAEKTPGGEFGTLLRKLRKQTYHSQGELAHAIGYAKDSGFKTISAWELGTKAPPRDKYLTLCNKLSASDEELKELGRLYTEWTGHSLSSYHQGQPISRQSIRLPQQNESQFIKDILQAPVPSPSAFEMENRKTRTFSRLFGATVALLKLWEVVNKYEGERLWRADQLLGGLRSSIEQSGLVDLEHAPVLNPWSAGFFRNIVYHSVTVVLHRCVYEKLGLRTEELRNKMFGWTFPEWLSSLSEQEGLSPKAQSMVLEVASAVAAYHDTEKGLDAINRAKRTLPQNPSLEQTYKWLNISGAQCAGIVFWLDTTAVYETEEDYSLSYDVLCVVAAKALIWTGEFRRTLLYPELKEQE